MPNRIIKESICYSDDIDKLTAFEETVFYRMIVRADDYGRLDARPSFLKSMLFVTKQGITEKNVQDAVLKMASVGLVRLYEVDGKPFLSFLKWDLHQRVRNSKEKYPAPPHALWESFGPAVTEDYKKYTEEEDCVSESMMFREECNYHFVNGTNNETDSSNQMVNMSTAASLYILPAIAEAVKREYVTQTQADHILKCVLEAAGKAMFGERYAIKACRDYLGVPNSVGEDGRILGGLIEILLQSLVCKYEVEAFNREEVVLVIDRTGLEITGTKNVPEAHLMMWQGMVKTLVNAQWSVWEEDSPARKMRVKIAKKIDKFM